MLLKNNNLHAYKRVQNATTVTPLGGVALAPPMCITAAQGLTLMLANRR
jgi:hypothetical protein